MNPLQLFFIFVAVITLGAAVKVVTVKNMVHAALWLVLSLFGIAIFFVILNAGFLAVVQVVIYIGAIAILMIFAVMLTRGMVKDIKSQINTGWIWAALISVVIFAGITWLLSSWKGFFTELPIVIWTEDPILTLGESLVSPNAYVIPFEIASVLLVSALIGAIMIASDKN